MRNPHFEFVRPMRFAVAVLLGLVWAGCGSDPVPAAKANVATPAAAAPRAAAAAKSTNALQQTKAVFNASVESGRDPFFPHARTLPTEESAGTPLLPLVSYLKLLGIRSGTDRPLALINRTPFAPGEEGDVSIVVTNQMSKAAIQKVSVHCLEIRRDSVLISIGGEDGVKELRMAQRK